MSLSVAELCDAYVAALPTLLIRRDRRPKKDSTVLNDKSRIEAHIKPLLGTLPVEAVIRKQVATFMHKVAAGETAKWEKRGQARHIQCSGRERRQLPALPGSWEPFSRSP